MSRCVRLSCIIVSILGAALFMQSCAPRLTSETPVGSVEEIPKERPPREVAITIMEATYDHGYLTVTGVVENVGGTAIEDFELSLGVLSADRQTVLGDDYGWPAGCASGLFAPGQRSAFELMASVPGAPDNITYAVIPVDEAIRFTVSYPGH